MEISPLGTQHSRARFDCGTEELNAFLKQYAGQNERLGLTRTYVATEPGSDDVLGYVTVRVGDVACDELPSEERYRLPRYPVPVLHIARLAVDVKARGQGLGAQLLMEAFRVAMAVSERAGLRGVEVVAKNEEAREFYRRFGLRPLTDDPLHLYIGLKTVAQLFRS